MKIISTACLLLFVFIGCKKEEIAISIEDFKGKTLICDSIRTTKGDVSTVAIKGAGTGYDIAFDSTRSYTLLSTPPAFYLYRIRSNRFYYWRKGTDPHLGDYMIIYLKSADRLELGYDDVPADTFIRYYYHKL